ncbi:MAG: D-alanyl-D-alanine carboxypeptidase family protein [Saccharofermentanales bacterium]|jgi:D-alanyl-D-alanine carboxypeptidase (penicillin-binding protein 5/6)
MKTRKHIVVWMLVALMMIGMMPIEARALDDAGWPTIDEINVASYCVVDAETKEIILSKNMHTRRQNASTTKIMTSLVMVEDEHFDPDAMLTVSPESLVFYDPNSARLEDLSPGQKIRALDCLGACMLASANDIARVIAHNFGGTFGANDPDGKNDANESQRRFVERMNARAVELGATDTHFTNPAGFDEPDRSHYTTAHDLAMMSAAAIQNPWIAHVCQQSRYVMHPTEDHPTAWWAAMSTSNALVIYGADALRSEYFVQYTGMKTGTTPQAGRCLVGSGITTDGRHLVCAAMGISNVNASARNQWLARAVPVRTLLEEAARKIGSPKRVPPEVLAIDYRAPEPVEPTRPVGTAVATEPYAPEVTEDLPGGSDHGGKVVVDHSVPPVFIWLSGLGLLAIIILLVSGMTRFVRWLDRKRASRKR